MWKGVLVVTSMQRSFTLQNGFASLSYLVSKLEIIDRAQLQVQTHSGQAVQLFSCSALGHQDYTVSTRALEWNWMEANLLEANFSRYLCNTIHRHNFKTILFSQSVDNCSLSLCFRLKFVHMSTLRPTDSLATFINPASFILKKHS